MGDLPACRVHHRDELGRRLPFLVWRLPQAWRVASSASVGGGIGERSWIINAQVASDYGRTDLGEHLRELARAALLDGDGVGLLTAADVGHATDVERDGVVVRASVGIRLPVLAGTAPGLDAPTAARPGTINIVVLVPRALTDGALVNVVTTVTEAKAQALFDAGVAGTGTASDAIAVACPCAPTDGSAAADPFGGPLSVWGGRAARASYAAVLDGVAHSRAVIARTTGGDRG
jgi:adenosylcobinamide hydrolase